MSNSKTFAFKLAQQNKTKSPKKKWEIREGVSVSGCTDPTGHGCYYAEIYYNGQYAGPDNGYNC
ncbi:hypothetical protein N9W89_11075 [Hellea sp.]|nr:hypothetical protein [Hellea sp.]